MAQIPPSPAVQPATMPYSISLPSEKLKLGQSLVVWVVQLGDRVEARQVIGQCTVVPQGSPRKEGAPLPSPPRTEELAVVSPVGGTVVSLAPSDVPLVCAADDETLEVAVLQTCAHPVVWNRMCNSCGAEVDPAKQSGAHAHTASRKMSHLDGKYGEFNFHGTELRRLERQAQRRLLEVRKLSLVLDLDETRLQLLNTARDPHIQRARDLTAHVHEHARTATAAGGPPDKLVLGASELYELKSYPMHFTKFRSFLGEFLQESAKLFELNIFTKGSRAYALDLAAIMDPDQRFFGANWARIISSDEKKDFAKDLQAQYPCPDTMVVILDDRDDVWEQTNPRNVLRVPAYRFWHDVWEVDKHFKNNYDSIPTRLQRLRQADHSDKTLPIMLGVLREVHQRFYAAHDAIADQAGQPVAAPASGLRASGDVKAELAKRRRAVLAGVHIVFSRCFDLRERAQDQDVWVLAEAFGGSCYEDLTPAVTHCVTRRYGTAKVNGTIKRKKHVVHVEWLKQSIKSWARLPESEYRLDSVLTDDPHHSDSVRHAWFSKTKKPGRCEARKSRTRVTSYGVVESDSDSGSGSDSDSGVDSGGSSTEEEDYGAEVKSVCGAKRFSASAFRPVDVDRKTLAPFQDEAEGESRDSLAAELEDFLASDGEDESGGTGPTAAAEDSNDSSDSASSDSDGSDDLGRPSSGGGAAAGSSDEADAEDSPAPARKRKRLDHLVLDAFDRR